MANNLIFNFIEKNMHLVTVNEEKLGRKVRTGGANLEVTTVNYVFFLLNPALLCKPSWNEGRFSERSVYENTRPKTSTGYMGENSRKYVGKGR